MAIITAESSQQASMILQGGIDYETTSWLRKMQPRPDGRHRSEFTRRMSEIAEVYSSEEAIRSAESTLRRHAHALDLDLFRLPESLEEFQSSKPLMRKWIMTNPNLKRRWLDDEAEGYGGEFDRFDNGIGEDDANWRTVMNGMEVLRDKQYEFTTYHGAEEMSHSDQLDIQHLWAEADYYMEFESQDPSSILGNPL